MQDPAVRCLRRAGGPIACKRACSCSRRRTCPALPTFRAHPARGRTTKGAAVLVELSTSDGSPTRARGEGLSARRSFHATRCGAQVVECCHGRQCRIPPSAVSDERGALSPASERARVLAGGRAPRGPHLLGIG